MRRTMVLQAVAGMLSLLLGGNAVQAGGFAVTTFGTRRTGMLASVAGVDDATALFHNPAALAAQKGARVHASGSVVFLDTEFSIQALDSGRFPELQAGCESNCAYKVGADGYYADPITPLSSKGGLPYVGVSQDLSLVSDFFSDWVVSAAVTAPNLYAGALPASGPSSYFFIDGYFVVVSSIMGVGWKINDALSVGGNLMYNYMRLRYSQRYSMSDVLQGRNPTAESRKQAQDIQNLIGDVRLDYEGQDHGLGWTVGLLYEPMEKVSFGLTYSDSTDARLRGSLEILPVDHGITANSFATVVNLAQYTLPNSLIVEMPIPPSLSAGVNVALTSRLEVGADCRLWFYNVYEEQAVIPIYDEAAPTDLKRPLTREQLSRDKNYGLSYDLSLGALFRPWAARRELAVMGGVGFDKSPVPDESFTIDNPSMDSYRFAAGVAWQGKAGLRVSLTYTYFAFVPRDVTNSKGSPPLNARGEGRSQAPRLEVEYLF